MLAAESLDIWGDRELQRRSGLSGEELDLVITLLSAGSAELDTQLALEWARGLVRVSREES